MSASRCFSAWYEASGRPNDHRSWRYSTVAPYIWSTAPTVSATCNASASWHCRSMSPAAPPTSPTTELRGTRTDSNRRSANRRTRSTLRPGTTVRPGAWVATTSTCVGPADASALTNTTSAPAAGFDEPLATGQQEVGAVFRQRHVDESLDPPHVGVFGQRPGGGRGARHQPWYDRVDQCGRAGTRERVDDDVHRQQRSRRDHPSHLLGHDREVDHGIVGEAPTAERRRCEERRPAELGGALPHRGVEPTLVVLERAGRRRSASRRAMKRLVVARKNSSSSLSAKRIGSSRSFTPDRIEPRPRLADEFDAILRLFGQHLVLVPAPVARGIERLDELPERDLAVRRTARE